MTRRGFFASVAMTGAALASPVIRDDAAQLQRRIDRAARSGETLVIGPGEYRLKRPLMLRSDVRVVGIGCAFILESGCEYVAVSGESVVNSFWMGDFTVAAS